MASCCRRAKEKKIIRQKIMQLKMHSMHAGALHNDCLLCHVVLRLWALLEVSLLVRGICIASSCILLSFL